MPETKRNTPENYIRLRRLARRHHETLWLGTRFLAEPDREIAEAVLGFDGELLRIAASVSEPMIGQIRYQWWSDQLETLAVTPPDQLQSEAMLLKPFLDRNTKSLSAVLDQLVASREQAFLNLKNGTIAFDHGKLFSALLIGLGEKDFARSHGDTLGALYAFTDVKEHHHASTDQLREFAEVVVSCPERVWPLLSIFNLLPDWLSRKPTTGLAKRWKVWTGFIAGEARLQQKVLALADRIDQAG